MTIAKLDVYSDWLKRPERHIHADN